MRTLVNSYAVYMLATSQQLLIIILISLLVLKRQSLIPYGGKLWRVKTLAKWQGQHHWRNKLWWINGESLVKRILKQFEDTSAPNLSIRARV